MDSQVTCPNCRNEFPIDQIMSAKMADTIRSELEAEFSQKAQKLNAERDEIAALKKKLETSKQQLDKQVEEAVAKERKKN